MLNGRMAADAAAVHSADAAAIDRFAGFVVCRIAVDDSLTQHPDFVLFLCETAAKRKREI